MLRALLLAALVPTGPAIPTPETRDATQQQFESLQREIAALEAEILAVEARQERPLPRELSERVDAIRQEAIYLRVKNRKHAESRREGTGLGASEVAELRAAVARLRDDVEAGERLRLEDERSVDESAAGEAELPADSVFAARLRESVSSETAEPGDRVEAVTTLPVTWKGDVLIPAGSSLFGAVELVDRAGRTDRTARIVIAFDRIDIEGRSQALTATVVGASEELETGVGSEKKKIGIGAGVGSVIGAVLGGGTGAVAGAILGGSGVLFGTEGKDVVLPPGTMLQVRLDRPLRLPLP